MGNIFLRASLDISVAYRTASNFPKVKEVSGVGLTNEDVFMNTKFSDFARAVVVVSRGGGGKKLQGETVETLM